MQYLLTLTGAVCFFLAPLRAQHAHIDIEPDTAVMVGQEVFFTAGRSPVNTDVAQDTFYWDFGDDYRLQWQYPSQNSNASGLSVCHYYMRPGTYTVTMTVHDADGTIDSTTRTVTVSGTAPKQGPRVTTDPLLELTFEDSGDDSSPNGLSTVWHGSAAYADGIEGRCADLGQGGYLEVLDPQGRLGGMEELTVSFWIRKPSPAPTTGSIRIIEKTNAFMFWSGGMQALGRVYNAAGNTRAGTYNFYPLRYGQMWHHVAMTYDGDSLRVYIDRREIRTERGALPGPVRANTNSLTIGAGSRDDAWTGYIDEVKIYDRALSVEEIFDGFEVWHAPFHARVSQYLYARIPGEITRDQRNRLRMTVDGDNGHHAVLADRTGLRTEETCLLVNGDLPAGTYTVTAQLLDGSGTELERVTEVFAKPYDGVPHMGIDRNNALCRDGKPFFFIRGLGLDRGYTMNWWGMGGYINALITEGWNAPHTVASYGQHLDSADDLGLVSIGPGGYWAGRRDLYYERNSSVDDMVPYFTAYNDHPAQLAWFFDDEPNLGGYDQAVPSAVLRSWSHYMNRYCPEQLSSVSYAGSGYYRGPDTWHRENIERYSYLTNASVFGRKTNITDMVWWDAYPSEQGDVAPEPDNTIKWWAAAMHVARDLNADLVPLINCMETCDIHSDDELRGPTPEEVRMMAWLNVVHGMKGVAWFHYFQPTATETFFYMAEFARQMDLLDTLVLGPEADLAVTDNADGDGNRVDVTVREDGSHYYIFAVRLTERWETEAPADIEVAFTIPGAQNGAEVSVPALQVPVRIQYAGTTAGQQFTLTLNDGAPVTPGTVQLEGGVYGELPRNQAYVWDDGDGTLSRLGTDNVVRHAGTVDYATGAVSVDFGMSVPAGSTGIVTVCQPDAGDLDVTTVTDGRFTDTFTPNDVRVYRIAKAQVGMGAKDTVPGRDAGVCTLMPNPSYGQLRVPGMQKGMVRLRDMTGAVAAVVPVCGGVVDWKRHVPGLAGGLYVACNGSGAVIGQVLIVNR